MAHLSTDMTEHNRAAELAIIAWMVEERTFVPVPRQYFYSSDTLATYDEIELQFRRTGEVSEALYQTHSKAVISEAMGMATMSTPQPMIVDLRRIWQRREAIRLASSFKLTQNHLDDIKNLVDRLTKLSTEDTDEYNHERSVSETLVYINEAKKSGRKMIGLPSNLEWIDRYIGGWQKGKTYVVGGMEKLGKSRFCLELAACWLSKKIGGAIFSMEMSANDIHECILANRATIDTSVFGTSNISDHELYNLANLYQIYAKDPLHISTKSCVSLEYIRATIRSQRIKMAATGHSLDWVVVDYIQRMVDGDDKAGKLEDVAKGLADIARDENVIMIPISQLSQAAERETDPSYSPHRFIKGSKGIRESADAILVLYKSKESGHYCYIVQRKGVSNISVRLIPQLQYARFRDEQV